MNVLKFMKNKTHNDEVLVQRVYEISKKLDELKKSQKI